MRLALGCAGSWRGGVPLSLLSALEQIKQGDHAEEMFLLIDDDRLADTAAHQGTNEDGHGSVCGDAEGFGERQVL